MKTRVPLREAVHELPVFDTHTHLNNKGVPLVAQTVWDIVHYFWFLQELKAVGYPARPMDLPEKERIGLFVSAFARVRNTVWAQMIQATLQNLYGMVLSDAASVRHVDEAIQAAARQPEWAQQVLNRLHIKRITVNNEASAAFPCLPGVGVALPRWNGYQEWTQRLQDAADPADLAGEAVAAMQKDVAGIAARGHRGMRVDFDMFENLRQEDILRSVVEGDAPPPRGASAREVQTFLTHTLLRTLGDHQMFAQLFMGIRAVPGTRTLMAVGVPRAVTNLYALFERYACGFELMAGAPEYNMDVVQAARIYPNVYAGGLWWYNFRNSTYQQAMQARLEALPAEKSSILASDGRCIEWCYAKTLLVKRLVANFLHTQITDGWINEADALWVAREWLHDAAARRYVA